MYRRLFAVAALACAGSLLAAYPQEKDKARDEKKEGKEVKVKIVKIDLAKKVLIVTTEEKRTMEVAVADEVKFVGPRGGVSKDGIKDDRVAVGAMIVLNYDAAGKVLKEIHLPYRTSDPKDKEVKDAKDK